MIAELAVSFAGESSNGYGGGRTPGSTRVLEEYGAPLLLMTQQPRFERVRP